MRTLAALLLLANVLFLALAQGWLLPLAGLSTHLEREPQRLAAQLHPETVRVVAAGAAAASEGTQCRQAGPFSAEQADAALAALADQLPAGSVQRFGATAVPHALGAHVLVVQLDLELPTGPARRTFSIPLVVQARAPATVAAGGGAG
jgi:hypothetical protein